MVMLNNEVNGRMSCLEKFEQSTAKSLLFLSSVVILEEPSTLSHMSVQKWPFVAPKMAVNLRPAKLKQTCDFGWNRTIINTISFGKPSHADASEKKIGFNFAMHESLHYMNTTSYNNDLNFWTSLPFFSEGEDEDEKSGAYAVFDTRDLQREIITEEHCCFTRAESFRYIYLIKKEIINLVPKQELSQAKNDTDFDGLLCEAIKEKLYLILLTGKNYGSLVDMSNLPKKSENPELYRAMENFALWEKRYVLPNIISKVKHEPKEKLVMLDTFTPGKCTDTYITEIFTPLFIKQLDKELHGSKKLLHEFDLEDDFLSILNFYISPQLCDKYNGKVNPDDFGHFYVSDYKPGDDTTDLDPFRIDASYNVFLPLSNQGQDYEGGQWNFVRYDCNMTVNKGQFLITPSDLTHLYQISPITSGHLKVVTFKVNAGLHHCYMENGGYICPGYGNSGHNMSETSVNIRDEVQILDNNPDSTLE